MPANVVVAPATAPVTLNEAKQMLLVDHTADDALILQLIEAATREAEKIARRSFVTQTREMVLRRWPINTQWNKNYPPNAILLEYPPVQSIVSIKYITDAGATVTLGSTDYELIEDLTPPYVWPGQNKDWPSVALRAASPIRVRYVAGYGETFNVPTDFKRHILGLIAVDYESREAISNNAAQQRRDLENRLRMDLGFAT